MSPKARQASSDSRRPRHEERRNVVTGQVHIKSTFNSTIVSITDPNGTVIASCSSGQIGFKGSRKSTPYAAQLAAEGTAHTAMGYGMKRIDVFVKGLGSGHRTAIRSPTASGLEVTLVSGVIPQTYNGCHPPERRRV